MKKIVYLCTLVLLCFNVMAQLNSGDNNWYSVIDEQFTGTGRSWDVDCFIENTRNPLWQVKCPELTSGVTTNPNNHHALQTYQCLFNNNTYSDDKMRLCATYTGGPQICGVDYQIPCGWHNCNNPNLKIYYHTGNIQTIDTLSFGYFEVRCAFPVHTGSHAAFWLWGCGPHSYEEIDIVEYSREDSQNDAYIHTQQQLAQLNAVKRSVVIANTNGLVLNSSTNKVVRATESITINGPFELQNAGKLTLLVHECPE